MSVQLLLPWPEDAPRADPADFLGRRKQRRITVQQQSVNGHDSVPLFIGGLAPNGAELFEIDATLRDGVGDVVFLGADEKMVGVATRRVVAGMADDQAISNLAMGQFPSDTTGTPPRPRAVEAHNELPVTLSALSPYPRPALSLRPLLDIGPEPSSDASWIALAVPAYEPIESPARCGAVPPLRGLAASTPADAIRTSRPLADDRRASIVRPALLGAVDDLLVNLREYIEAQP